MDKKQKTNDVTLSGRVVLMFPDKTGEKNDKTWYMRQVMIETKVGKYINQVLVTAWNDTGDIIQDLSIGDEVDIKANVSTIMKRNEPATSIVARSIIKKTFN